MKKILLVLLIGFVAEHAPYRLAAVTTQALVMPAGYIRIRGGTDRYWDVLNLELRLARLGWKVEYVSGLRDQGMYGLTQHASRLIRVDAGLSWNDRLSVLAHEGGHALQPGQLSPGQSEVFAESVAVLVVGGRHREHARYLAMWRADLGAAAVYWREIYRVAAILQGR